MTRFYSFVMMMISLMPVAFAQSKTEVQVVRLDKPYKGAVVLKVDNVFKPLGILANYSFCENTTPLCEQFIFEVPSNRRETRMKNEQLLLDAIKKQETIVRVCSLYSQPRATSHSSGKEIFDVYMQQVDCKLENADKYFNALRIGKVSKMKAPLTDDQTKNIVSRYNNLEELMKITGESGLTSSCTMVVGYRLCPPPAL